MSLGVIIHTTMAEAIRNGKVLAEAIEHHQKSRTEGPTAPPGATMAATSPSTLSQPALRDTRARVLRVSNPSGNLSEWT